MSWVGERDDGTVSPAYADSRFPAKIIGHAVWRHFRLPLSLRRVGKLLAARGTIVSDETGRQRALKFGQTGMVLGLLPVWWTPR